jgi:hypothetical protein
MKKLILLALLISSGTFYSQENNNKENKEKIEVGVVAKGEIAYSEEEAINLELEEKSDDHINLSTITDCTILYANSTYQKPNIIITKGKISVSLGRNVQKIQLRSVPGNGIRFFKSGTYKIPNGEYVLSLFGSTYPYNYIKACVTYE